MSPTEKVSAPGFDVVKKYVLSLDVSSNTLFIYEYHYGPNDNREHDTQHMYEVPVGDLSQSRIYVDHGSEGGQEVYARLNDKSGKPTIAHYWFDDDELVSVQLQNTIAFGPWAYSLETKSKLEEAIRTFNQEFSLETETINKYSDGQVIFKYGSERAVMIGDQELDGELYDGYYLAEAVDIQPMCDHKGSYHKTIKRLKKEINNHRHHLSLRSKKGTIHIFNIDEEGRVDLYHSVTNEPPNRRDTIHFGAFAPAVLDDKKVKCKIVFKE